MAFDESRLKLQGLYNFHTHYGFSQSGYQNPPKSLKRQPHTHLSPFHSPRQPFIHSHIDQEGQTVYGNSPTRLIFDPNADWSMPLRQSRPMQAQNDRWQYGGSPLSNPASEHISTSMLRGNSGESSCESFLSGESSEYYTTRNHPRVSPQRAYLREETIGRMPIDAKQSRSVNRHGGSVDIAYLYSSPLVMDETKDPETNDEGGNTLTELDFESDIQQVNHFIFYMLC